MPPSSGPDCVRWVYFNVQRFISFPPPKINMGKVGSGSLSGPVGEIVQQATGCTRKVVAVDGPEWSPIQVLIVHDIDYCCGWWGDWCVLKLCGSGDDGKEEA
jgi:hypothetical protein